MVEVSPRRGPVLSEDPFHSAPSDANTLQSNSEMWLPVHARSQTRTRVSP